MKLYEKYLNEERLIKSIDVNITFKKPLSVSGAKGTESFIKSLLKKELNTLKIDIDHKYK